MTTAEVARLLGVTPRRVRALKGRIGGWRLTGKVLLFKRAAVTRFLTLRGVKS